MTQRNIDVMDIIVGKMEEGEKLSQALKFVYHQRKLCLPCNDDDLDVSVMSLGLSNRATNALMRSRLKTLGDVVEFCKTKKITEVSCLGKTSGVEIFEMILDYCWDRMTKDEQVEFLIDTVERNTENIREGIA